MTVARPRQMLVFPYGTMKIAVYTETITLQDINLGSPYGELINEPVDLPTRPLILVHAGGSHEILNSLLFEGLRQFHHNQRLCCNIVKKSDLDEGGEKIVRFINREVAWCGLHSKHPRDGRRKAWHAVYDALHHDNELSLLMATRLFNRHCLTMRHVVRLCQNRTTEPTLSGYKKMLGASS